MSAKIPMAKSVGAGEPGNAFTNYSALGQAAGEVDYSKIPHVATRLNWLIVVPFRSQKPSTIALPDQTVEKGDSYLVVGSNPSIDVHVGDIVKIVETSKRKIPLETDLASRFQNQIAFAVPAVSIIWVLRDELDKLVV